MLHESWLNRCTDFITGISYESVGKVVQYMRLSPVGILFVWMESTSLAIHLFRQQNAKRLNMNKSWKIIRIYHCIEETAPVDHNGDLFKNLCHLSCICC